MRALAERLAAPVLTTYGGRGVLPPGHPCDVGMPPHVEPAGRLWDEADLVIAFGSDLDGMNTQNWLQPQPERLLAVNVDPEDASKNYPTDICVGALDVERIRQREGSPVERLREVRAAACRALDPRALRFLDAISYAVPDDANLVCDMCIPGYWIGGFHGFHHPRKLHYPVGWGTLGFAFPAALGVSLAGTGPTVSISGDGGFLFACGELATMAQERLPFTAVIVDDGGYGMLRYDQVKAGDEPYGVDLHTPDFAAMAESFGVRAETVEGLDDAFGEALARHVADDAPSVLVAKAEMLTPPPTTSPNWYRKRGLSRLSAGRARRGRRRRAARARAGRRRACPLSSPARRSSTTPATVSAGMTASAAVAQRVADRVDDPRLGEARADGVDADALGGERRERAHEPDDGVLVRRVQRVVGHAGEPGERGRRDDRAAAAAAERGQRGVHAEHDAVEVGPHRAAVAARGRSPPPRRSRWPRRR